MNTVIRNIISFGMLIITVAVLGASSTSSPRILPIEPYIYVSGGVQNPGRYDWINGMTVLDGVRAAGGFLDSAGHKVNIFHVDDGSDEIYDRNILEITNKPPLLRAGDEISVPRRIF
jgi:protein involved in polysaccharide export with SLBB domain